MDFAEMEISTHPWNEPGSEASSGRAAAAGDENRDKSQTVEAPQIDHLFLF